MKQAKTLDDTSAAPLGASRKESIGAILFLVLISAVALRPSIRGHDGMGNYAYLMSVLNDGDLNFTNDYAAFDMTGGANGFLMSAEPRDPVSHFPANRYGVGSAVFWAPAVIPVHYLLRAVSPEQATGLTEPYAWAVGVASAFWGCLGVWLLFMRLRESASGKAAWLAAAAIPFATPLGFYLWGHGSMSHAVSFFAAVMALLQWENAARRWSVLSGVMCGLWAGLMALIRFQDVTWIAALGIALLFVPRLEGAAGEGDAEEGARVGVGRRLAVAAAFGVGALVAMVPQMAVWHELYGSAFSGPLPYLGREGGSPSVVPVHLLSVLFGARHGLLTWHPVLLFAIAGLVMMVVRRLRSGRVYGFAAAGLLGLGLQLWLVSGWSMWWAGASFGNRFFISSLPWLAVGLAFFFERVSRRIGYAAVAILVGALCVWNAGLLAQYGLGLIPREQAVDWIEVTTNMFTTLPGRILDRL